MTDARELARKVLVWFIDYLLWVDEHLRGKGITYDRYPQRRELLSLLDIDKAALDRMTGLIGIIPGDFPRLQR